MDSIVYLNGNLIPYHEAAVSLLDYGFLYGYGIFETMRAYDGRVFRLTCHLERLASTATVLEIDMTTSDLTKAVAGVLRANRLDEARVRVTVSRGEGAIVPNPESCRRPTVAVLATPYQPPPKEVYQRGFHACLSGIRLDSGSPLAGLKTANYLPNLLARAAARRAGADDAILLNERGELAEASSSNIFLVTNGILKTPFLESGILPGITRAVVLELAAGLSLPAIEGSTDPEELYRADEAFLTNSLMEIMPLTRIEGRAVGDGAPGPLTNRLTRAYRELVKRAR